MAPKPSIVDKIVAKYGIPDRIYLDNGRAFTSKAVRDGLTALGIEVHYNAPFSAKSRRFDGRVVDLTEANVDDLLDER